MLWEKKLAQWATSLRHQADLPMRIAFPGGQRFDLGSFQTPAVTIHVKSLAAMRYLLHADLARLGEAYVTGKIDIEGKLADIIQYGYALAQKTASAARRRHRLRPLIAHTKRADREAIAHHYDVSNDFYRLWLDERMVYSCAYFERGDEDLAAAQLKKIDHILHKIRLRPGDTLLDVGCGWGALAIRAAQAFGARCVGVTLSQQQMELARERVARAGLSDRVDIRLEDYREVKGQFDRITSVGMFEHVGLRKLPGYFACLHRLIKDDGLIMNHGITSTDAFSGDSPMGGGEFISRYVFPDGELPHLSLALQAMQQGGLEVLDVENLRRHYARTLACWSDNFEARRDEIQRVVPEAIYRVWRVYLAGCAQAFERDDIAIFQVACRKAGCSAQSIPWNRRYIYEH